MLTKTTADIYDQYHQHLRVCEIQFRSYGQRRGFYGPAALVRTFEDHLPVLAALKEAGQGRVLVVDGGGSLRVGIMGDRIAGVALANDWAGVVIHGVIRDSVVINDMDIGVKALGATARRGWAPIETGPVASVDFGGIRINAGDWIYADEDGVLGSPTELDLNAIELLELPTTPQQVMESYQ